MATFRDCNGNEYIVRIDTRIFKEIRNRVTDEMGKRVNLMRLINDSLAVSLAIDPALVSDILWVCCEKAAIDRGITQEAFESAIYGDSLDSAFTAVMEAATDFFRKEDREAVQKIAATVSGLKAADQEAIIQNLTDLAEQTKPKSAPTPLN